VRIHIVCRDHTSDQILARLAAELSTDAAFSIGPAPDPKASLNYYAPYLEWDAFRGFNSTPVAAWFTHRDDNRPDKVTIWNECAAAVHLRTTSAKVYQRELEQYGPTALVTTPLDRDKFSPANEHPKHERFVIGTSGFVYPGGRKGEHLFAQLGMLYIKHDFVASGQGWPGIPTKHYAWDRMQEFYHGLDLYVCTSEIEGIGYGPLEAMACGIPVVIPRGVGVFDELPDLENVHRYEAGDLASLRAAVDVALSRLTEGAINVASLRGATARFSHAAWINEHLEAFESFLYDKPHRIPTYPWQGKAGVYYVAYGEPARDCARRAIASFKKHMPGVEIALASDAPLNAGEDIFIEHSDDDVGARSVKTEMYDVTPAHWEYVLYLDADTEITQPVPFLFDALEDGWSMVICTNPGKYATGSWMRRPDNEEECNETFKLIGTEEFLQFNGGVLAFRRHESTANFFHAWHQEWKRYGRRDQAALDRALYADPIRIYVLGNEWNTITRYIDAERTAGILHYCMSARRWRGLLPGRLDSDESWAAVHPETMPKDRKP
jgi:hypothetical protein